MRLPSCFRWIFTLTVLAVCYIHMQMQIIDLAYQGKDKEQDIRKLIEDNGHLTYKILTMKSSRHLGGQMLTENSDMQFVDPNDVVFISDTDFSVEEEADVLAQPREGKIKSVLSLLSLGAQAEAKP